MFVPTHKHINRNEFAIVSKYFNETCVQIRAEDGYSFNLTVLGDIKFWKPITLTCPNPTCNATLNQQERIECECGFTGEALSEGVAKKLLKADNLLMMHPKDKESFKTNSNDLIIWIMNDIDWLEIKPSREKSE